MSEAVEHRHNAVKEYSIVIAVLTAVTMVELVIILPPVKEFYRANLAWFVPLVPAILIILSAAKFLGVVFFFMHLKQDRGTPRRVFFGPLVLAGLMILVLILLYGSFAAVTSALV
jgi:cytochrome c oxidase subunit 4